MRLPIDKKRLALEHLAMMERWSALQPRLCQDSSGNRLWWEVELTTPEGSRVPITIEYPPHYPTDRPWVTLRQRLPPGTPHMMVGNRIDLPGSWKSDCTAATAVFKAIEWLCAYAHWQETGLWPVRDACLSIQG
jgi:hypothetical protein